MTGWRRTAAIVAAARAVLERAAPGDHRILVVDDGSPDGTGDIADVGAFEAAIKGFAITLSVGLLANLFTAGFGSRVIFDFWFQRMPRGAELSG